MHRLGSVSGRLENTFEIVVLWLPPKPGIFLPLGLSVYDKKTFEYDDEISEN